MGTGITLRGAASIVEAKTRSLARLRISKKDSPKYRLVKVLRSKKKKS
jgi:hypothetical protein